MGLPVVAVVLKSLKGFSKIFSFSLSTALTIAKMIIVVGFYAALTTGIFMLWNAISNLKYKFELFVSGETTTQTTNISSCLLEAFSYGLKCSGIADGLNNSLPFLYSAVSFTVGIIAHRYFISLIKQKEREMQEKIRLLHL